MPAKRIGTRDAREIIRLKSSSVSTHEIARRLGLARSTVRETLTRAEAAGLAWPLPDDMTDGALEAALYASRRSKRGHRRIAEPDWVSVHRELKRKHVTLLILWDEYVATNPDGYSYSRFCELYRAFEKTLSVTMRQTHAAGERLFVDYAGDGVPVVIDRLTGEIRMAQIFVAALGASSFTFAKASWTQALPDGIDAHVRAFQAIGGVPELVVPDNADTAIVKAKPVERPTRGPPPCRLLRWSSRRRLLCREQTGGCASPLSSNWTSPDRASGSGATPRPQW
jgi:transposase